ncbi:MAG: hypothetical protein AAB480_01595 [Patescibacteria group bacterium]
MKRLTYPKWIDAYTKSMHQAFVGMTPADWGPLDFNQCFRALNGAFIEKLHEAIVQIKRKKIPAGEVARHFLSPSGFRAVFYFAVTEYAFSDHTKRAQAREVFDFFNGVLGRMFKKDIWAYESNVIHSENEVAALIRRTPWTKGSSDSARLVARLGNSASALSYALYRDYYVAESQEVYGPYDASSHFGPHHILVIKHYPKMRPIALWPQARTFRHADKKLYLIYEGVKMKCEFIGMHTRYEGDLMSGLRKYAVEIDGVFYNDPKAIKKKTEYIGGLAVKQWGLYRSMSKQDLKMKFLEWMCWSCRPLFELAGTDTGPSDTMMRNLKRARIADRIKMPAMMSYRKYLKSRDWEAYWLKDLYTK